MEAESSSVRIERPGGLQKGKKAVRLIETGLHHFDRVVAMQYMTDFSASPQTSTCTPMILLALNQIWISSILWIYKQVILHPVHLSPLARPPKNAKSFITRFSLDIPKRYMHPSSPNEAAQIKALDDSSWQQASPVTVQISNRPMAQAPSEAFCRSNEVNRPFASPVRRPRDTSLDIHRTHDQMEQVPAAEPRRWKKNMLAYFYEINATRPNLQRYRDAATEILERRLTI